MAIMLPDGLEDLGLEDVDWAGNATVLLDYVKGRTRRESLNLPGPGYACCVRWRCSPRDTPRTCCG